MTEVNFSACGAEIEKLYAEKKVNEWSKEYLLKVCQSGLTDDLWEETVRDMILASSLGVSSEDDFRTFFYIDHFIEDLVNEIFGVKLTEAEENELKSYMFSIKNQVSYTDLVSFRVAVLKWLQNAGKTVKKAFRGSHTRNNSGTYYYLKKYNMEYWKVLVDLVRKATVYGIPKNVALREAADQLEDDSERFDFLSWYKFQYGNAKSLYDINKQIQEKSRGNLTMTKPATKLAGIHEDSTTYYIPHMKEHPTSSVEADKKPTIPAYDEQRAQDFSVARSKMISRTFAIDKLLEKYMEVLGDDCVEEIEDALNALRKKVRKLRMASTVNDCFHKTAGILDKRGFNMGSEMLRLIADERPLKKVAINEAKSSDLEGMLTKLYDISDALKRRDLVRLLAEVDLKLYDLNIAGFFPELTDAQSKLIDAYGYASNKIQDVIPKLRSGVSQGGGISIEMDDEDLPLSELKKAKPPKRKKEEFSKTPAPQKVNKPSPAPAKQEEEIDLTDEVSELVRAIERPIVE